MTVKKNIANRSGRCDRKSNQSVFALYLRTVSAHVHPSSSRRRFFIGLVNSSRMDEHERLTHNPIEVNICGFRGEEGYYFAGE